MNESEFSRPVDIRQADGKQLTITANEAERAALAQRFDILQVGKLEAEVTLEVDGDNLLASGRFVAEIVQSCAVSAEDLPVSINEPVAYRFVPALTQYAPDEEIEIDHGDHDEIEYAGTTADLGEAVAQSLALAIDPFATGPGADAARDKAGIGTPEDNSPFAALKALKSGKD